MRIEIKYGVIFAAVVVAYVLIEHVLGLNTHRHELGQYTRLAGVLVPIIGVYAVIAAKRRSVGGRITFAQGFKSGSAVAVIQTTLTTLWFWLYGSLINPRFLPSMLEFERTKALAGGLSDSAAAARVDEMTRMYSFPNLQLFQEVIGIAYGVLFAAIFAVVLRRGPKPGNY